MIYNYDGSFDGLLTIVFEKYKEIGACEIAPKADQINFLESEFLDTDLVKAERVVDSIKANIGEEFLLMFLRFLSLIMQKKKKL